MWTRIVSVLSVLMASGAMGVELTAFPGAVGQGAVTAGGRGGDVYHVTNLLDYTSSQAAIPGSLRYGVTSANGPRTIVFDVGGALQLARPLSLNRDDMTIAGQTAPTGVTLWGYPTSITGDDVVLRFLRFRTGDFNAQTSTGGNGNMDLAPDQADALDINGARRVIVDHVSASWSMDESLSVTQSRNVTVQYSIISESLNHSLHPDGDHGFGSLVRGDVTSSQQAAGTNGYTFYGNLWAHNKERNAAIGGQQILDPGQSEASRRRGDVNFVDNVVFDWGRRPTHTLGDSQARINVVNNYYINGPALYDPEVFFETGSSSGDTSVYQIGNRLDSDRNGVHNGYLINTQNEINNTFLNFESGDVINAANGGAPFNFYASVSAWTVTANTAYDRVVATAGASAWRDVIDQRIINDLIQRTGGLLNSQEQWRINGVLPGIDDLPYATRPVGFDSDGDGMPDAFEIALGLNPNNAADRNGFNLSNIGYTNLEVYLNSLVAYLFPPMTLLGDANLDGVVDNLDYLAVEQHFGQLGAVDGYLLGDANHDGRVDGADILAVDRYWGAVLSAEGVVYAPEPGTLLVLACCVVGWRRGRSS